MDSPADKRMIYFYVCIPVYNVEEYLRECVDSVLNQTYKNYEVVLIDDGSTDASGKICDKFSEKYKHINVIHQENKGLYSARKRAINFCLSNKDSGKEKIDVIISLDSDDTLKPNTLQVLKEYFSENGNLDVIIYGLDRLINNEIEEKSRGELELVVKKDYLYSKVFNNNRYNPICRKAVKLELFNCYTFFDSKEKINKGEDLLHSLPIYERAKEVLFIPENLYNYRLNPSSITQSINCSDYQVNYDIRKLIDNFLRRENIWSKEEFDNYDKYCKKIIKRNLQIISSFQDNKSKQKSFFIETKNDDFVLKRLSNLNCFYDIPLYFLKKDHYKMIIYFYSVKNKLSEIKGNLKNRKKSIF